MTLTTILTGLLSLFFLFASSIKILGWQKFIFETQLAMFVKYGLNRAIMRLVGFVELFGALAIWSHGDWLGVLGAGAILATSVGAIFCHFVWDTWKDGVPAMATGAISGALVFFQRDLVLAVIGGS